MNILFVAFIVIVLLTLLGVGIYFIIKSSTPTQDSTSNPAFVPSANPGDAISCTGYNPKGAGAIYRYDGAQKMRWYPNPTIAGSWDPNWSSGSQRVMDCTGFTLGEDIQQRV